MVDNLTVIIPFYNGHQHINKLIESIERHIPVIIVDDQSDEPLINRWGDTRRVWVVRPTYKGYFTGAVNVGIEMCETDVLVLNQDTWFESVEWWHVIERNRGSYAMIGERIRGTHPSFGALGYIHGTFMFLRRDAIKAVGLLNEADYPLWGSTAEYQWRVARKSFSVLPLATIPGFHHDRKDDERYGGGIRSLLDQTPTVEKYKLVRTPPLVSVIVPCYNYGRYVSDCVNSLIGGTSSLGMMKAQTFQSFEVIIVDDASRDTSWESIQAVVSEEKGVRAYRLDKNQGTAGALNFGIERAVGKYITFLSADDMREADSLEALVRRCETHPHSFAYDDIMLFVKHKRVKEWRMLEYDFDKILYKNHVHAGIMFPKRAWEEVGGYPQIMRDGREDWAFNVALGINGWCGEHVHQPGYLYRREQQNRSLRNTSPDHHQMFLRRVSALFPEVYGGYRPAMCCGKKPKVASGPSMNKMSQPQMQKSVTMNRVSGGSNLMAASTGAPGFVGLNYKGKQQPTVWDGGVTNTRYRFGVGKEFGWVDIRDAGERGKRGFLSLKDTHGNWLFEEDKGDPVTQTVVAPPPQADVQVVIGVAPISGSHSTAVVHGTLTGVRVSEVSEETDEDPEILPVVEKAIFDDFPNPSEYNAREVMAMELSRSQWQRIYQTELASEKPRKGLITWLEEKLASV